MLFLKIYAWINLFSASCDYPTPSNSELMMRPGEWTGEFMALVIVWLILVTGTWRFMIYWLMTYFSKYVKISTRSKATSDLIYRRLKKYITYVKWLSFFFKASKVIIFGILISNWLIKFSNECHADSENGGNSNGNASGNSNGNLPDPQVVINQDEPVSFILYVISMQVVTYLLWPAVRLYVIPAIKTHLLGWGCKRHKEYTPGCPMCEHNNPDNNSGNNDFNDSSVAGPQPVSAVSAFINLLSSGLILFCLGLVVLGIIIGLWIWIF